MVEAASVSLGVKALAEEMGITFEKPMVFNSDASAAIVWNRIGTGQIRHLKVSQLWLQQEVLDKVISLVKVATDDNLADALTKGVDRAALEFHAAGVGMELRSDVRSLAPILEDNDEAEMKMADEGPLS